MRKIPVITPYFTDDEIEEITKVLKSGWVALGPETAEFEKVIAKHEGVEFGIATTSCTTALHLLMVTMGMNEQHDVIVPSFTFVASANSVEYTGATAVLADVRKDTFTLDPVSLESKIQRDYQLKDGSLVNCRTGKTLFGIVVVNQFGICADIPKINEIARKYNIKVIEDSACAFGADIDGKSQGAFGNPSCISLHPRKSITTGEGGMILLDDPELAAKARTLRSHGASVSEAARHSSKGFLLPEYNELGYNYRMTDIQAAVGIAQMKKFDYILSTRRKLADRYSRLIPSEIDFLKIPCVPAGYGHTYQSYVCMVDYKKLGFETVEQGNEFRNNLMNTLEDNGISTRQGTHAVHLLGYYKKKYNYDPLDLPNAYECDRLSVTLPMYVQMTNDDQDYVLDNIRKTANDLLK